MSESGDGLNITQYISEPKKHGVKCLVSIGGFGGEKSEIGWIFAVTVKAVLWDYKFYKWVIEFIIP